LDVVQIGRRDRLRGAPGSPVPGRSGWKAMRTPDSGVILPKSTWVSLQDGYIFACRYYKH
jgi:hypothetical protein